MDTKKVLLIGGGLAAVYMISRAFSVDPILEEIRKTATEAMPIFKQIYEAAVSTGAITPTKEFENVPFYLITIRSKTSGISGTMQAATDSNKTDVFPIESPLYNVLIPCFTEYKHEQIRIFSVTVNGRSFEVDASKIQPTTFNKMISGDASYHLIQI